MHRNPTRRHSESGLPWFRKTTFGITLSSRPSQIVPIKHRCPFHHPLVVGGCARRHRKRTRSLCDLCRGSHAPFRPDRVSRRPCQPCHACSFCPNEPGADVLCCQCRREFVAAILASTYSVLARVFMMGKVISASVAIAGDTSKPSLLFSLGRTYYVWTPTLVRSYACTLMQALSLYFMVLGACSALVCACVCGFR